MRVSIIFLLYLSSFIFVTCDKNVSPIEPFTTYEHSIILQSNVAELWWTVNHTEQEILFELHIKTTGWVALGISPAGGMKGADIAVAWVDSNGKAYIQDRFAFGKAKPIIDNTTQDWILLQGQEQNGWTAVQFKRYFDTCDPMDVAIKSGTNILIFAYGLVDIDLCQPTNDITYHDERRGSRILPLRSYSNPPSNESLVGLDFVDFRFDNHIIPSADTTYHCKVFKSPSKYTMKKHAIAHQVLVDSRNINLVHHLDLFECTSTDLLDENKLPDGICDDIVNETRMCSSRIATSWAVGADVTTRYPDEAGYPVTVENETKYFMIKMHYDNSQQLSNRRDSSGIRFYFSENLRPHDLGYTIFGVSSTPASLAIPPGVDKFFVDTYCPPEATQNLPETGINIISALPHTHLQGVSVWTKLIRNNTAVDYVFNVEAFDFNHQFANQLPKPIKIYPGDAFVTRCVYSTTNKNEITLGGQRTADEMCSHTFSYYPLTKSLVACITTIDERAWQTMMNISTPPNNIQLTQWLKNISWTTERAIQWQEFYNKAPRRLLFDRQMATPPINLSPIPAYQDLPVENCNKKQNAGNMQHSCDQSSAAVTHKHTFHLVLFTLIILFLKGRSLKL